jgi:hypothetical protein
MACVHGHPQPITGAQRDGHFRDDRVLGHHLEGVGLGNGRQDQVHFHEGKRFAKTSPRPFTKRDVGTPVPGGGLCRCEALRLKLLGLGSQRRMPMENVLTDHHRGILRDRIAANRVSGIRLARQDHRGGIETQGLR